MNVFPNGQALREKGLSTVALNPGQADYGGVGVQDSPITVVLEYRICTLETTVSGYVEARIQQYMGTYMSVYTCI